MRTTAGKTQSELAVLLKTSQGEVSRLERRDNVEIATVRAYARALGYDCEIVCRARKREKTRGQSPVKIVADLISR
jgi:transcriptional regulator with XRE-family HTH domain